MLAAVAMWSRMRLSQASWSELKDCRPASIAALALSMSHSLKRSWTDSTGIVAFIALSSCMERILRQMPPLDRGAAPASDGKLAVAQNVEHRKFFRDGPGREPAPVLALARPYFIRIKRHGSLRNCFANCCHFA